MWHAGQDSSHAPSPQVPGGSSGIDLSRRMVPEAHTLAHTRGHHNTAFCQADAEALPFLIVVFGVLMSIAWRGTSLTTTSALLSRWF